MARVASVSLVQAGALSRSTLVSVGTGRARAKTAAHMAVQSAFVGAPLSPQPMQLSNGEPCGIPAMESRALTGPIIGMACTCALATNARTNSKLANRRIRDMRTRQLWGLDSVRASRSILRGDLSRVRELASTGSLAQCPPSIGSIDEIYWRFSPSAVISSVTPFVISTASIGESTC